MQKKLFLLALMIVVLISVFTISIFAEEIIVSKTESEEYGTIIQLNSDPGLDNASQYVSTLKKIGDNGTDKEALCILTDGNADNPSYYVFPSSYIVDEREDGVFDIIATQLATAMAEFNTANGTSYYADYALDGSEGSKRLNSVVRFVFPSSVLSANVNVCLMKSYANLVEIRFNHAIDFSNAKNMFFSDKKLATVIGFEKMDSTKLSSAMFASCSAIRYIKLPTDIVKIPGSFFQGAKGVNVVNMEELTQLTTIDSWAFDGTQNLVITLPDSVTTLKTSAFESAFKEGGSITINPTSQLTTIGEKAFSASVKLSSIYIPSTVTTIGANAFNGSGVKTLENFENCQITTIKKGTFEAASNLISIKIPETVTTIENAFLGNKNLKKVYIPFSVTSIADTFLKSTWSEAPTNVVFLYTGNDTSIFADCAVIKGANVIPTSEYVESNTYTGMNLVVEYSVCLAYNNGVHGTLEIGSVDVISYLKPITVKNKCTVCNYNTDNRIISPLFTCIGYSIPENGRKQITIGYTVNNDAIADYSAITGKTVKYGVFAVAQDNFTSDEIFASDGTVAKNAVSIELSSKYAGFEFKITGFKDNQVNKKLALGAYAITSDESSTKYSYMQETLVGDLVGNYYFVSFNDILNYYTNIENK